MGAALLTFTSTFRVVRHVYPLEPRRRSVTDRVRRIEPYASSVQVETAKSRQQISWLLDDPQKPSLDRLTADWRIRDTDPLPLLYNSYKPANT
jgi:hypothetical protein